MPGLSCLFIGYGPPLPFLVQDCLALCTTTLWLQGALTFLRFTLTLFLAVCD